MIFTELMRLMTFYFPAKFDQCNLAPSSLDLNYCQQRRRWRPRTSHATSCKSFQHGMNLNGQAYRIIFLFAASYSIKNYLNAAWHLRPLIWTDIFSKPKNHHEWKLSRSVKTDFLWETKSHLRSKNTKNTKFWPECFRDTSCRSRRRTSRTRAGSSKCPWTGCCGLESRWRTWTGAARPSGSADPEVKPTLRSWTRGGSSSRVV